VACLLALPAAAMAATTAQVSASFTGGRLGAGTSMHFGFVTNESAGGLPQLPTEAVIHLPKGTHIANLTRLPKNDACSSNTLEASGFGPSACPKGSHAGPVGSAHLEAVIGGHPTTVKATIYPVIDKVGVISLLISSPAPFPTIAAVLFPYAPGGSQELILREIGGLEAVSPGVRAAILDFSITLGANLKVKRRGRSTTEPLITMPKSCPAGGFSWSTDFTYWDASTQTTTTTSPCPGKRAAATAHPASTLITAFQCEKAFKSASARSRCFNQLPGANCSYPLEAQTAGSTHRGDTRDLVVTDNEEPEGSNVWQSWSWRPKNKNVAICPYPNGVVYRVSLLSDRTHCQRIHGEEICSSEYDTKTMHEHTTRFGGEFTYHLIAPPIKSFYLAVKGYYIHPPWKRHSFQSNTSRARRLTRSALAAGSRYRHKKSKPGSSCAHPVKAGIAADRWKGGPGVELTDESVVFPHEGTPPPGWADITMGPVTTVPRTYLSYRTIGWKLDTSAVSLCRVLMEEYRPGTAPDGGLNLHYITLPNHTEASYNIELDNEYNFGLTLFERYRRG
jgi:hypothetical protein